MTIETRQSRTRFWAYAILILGIVNLIDWLYGGRNDLHDVLLGLGLLLAAPAAFFDSDPVIAERLRAMGRASIIRPLMYVGAVLAIAGILVDWM